MADGLAISDVRFTPASALDVATGLVGFVSLRCCQLRLDGIALRRTRAGELALSFPAPRRRGVPRPLVRPLDAAVRAAIEAVVLAELAAQGALP